MLASSALPRVPNAGMGISSDNNTKNNYIVFKKSQQICPHYGERLTQQEVDDTHSSLGSFNQKRFDNP